MTFLNPAFLNPVYRERSGAISAEKTVALVAALLPMAWLLGQAFAGTLGARPVTEAIHFTGLWALRFLLISLAVTPVRRIFAWNKLILARRTLGLAALGYGLVHLSLYVVDQGAARAAQEIVLRFYLTIGAVALAFMLALGVTSTNGAIRRMGAERWSRLHKLAYAIAVLGVIHYFIQSKLDVTEPVLMAGVLVYLFAYRIAQRAWREVGSLLLAALAVVSAVLTAGIEMAWYGLATRVDPWLVLEANFSLDLGLRPVWWIFLASLAVAGLGAISGRVRPKPGHRRQASAHVQRSADAPVTKKPVRLERV